MILLLLGLPFFFTDLFADFCIIWFGNNIAISYICLFMYTYTYIYIFVLFFYFSFLFTLRLSNAAHICLGCRCVSVGVWVRVWVLLPFRCSLYFAIWLLLLFSLSVNCLVPRFAWLPASLLLIFFCNIFLFFNYLLFLFSQLRKILSERGWGGWRGRCAEGVVVVVWWSGA